MNVPKVDSAAKEQLSTNERHFNLTSKLTSSLLESPIPNVELINNLVLYQDRRAISRILFLSELYGLIENLHGSVFEFGTRYGANTSILTSLRGIHEPYNHNRKIITFDTFEGFPIKHSSLDPTEVELGDYGVPSGYENHLETILSVHEQLAPLEQIKKFEIIKGNVLNTLPEYLTNHQETIIAMAYLDFDLYDPTITALKHIEPFLTPGAVIAFDEINVEEWPGETTALREWLGDRNMSIKHSAFRANAGYVIFDRN